MLNNTKTATSIIKRLLFFLILSADTIRLSADSFIAFKNILIVSMGSLIGWATQQGLQICLLYFGFDFEGFSESQNKKLLDNMPQNNRKNRTLDQREECR